MFGKGSNKKPELTVDAEIQKLYDKMNEYEVDSAEYAACLDRLNKLMTIRDTEASSMNKERESKKGFDWLRLLEVVGTLAIGIAAPTIYAENERRCVDKILKYEETDVVSTKAVGFLRKGRG